MRFRRLWEAVRVATKTDMLVIFWKGKCLAHLGYGAKGLKPGTASPGNLCNESISKDVPRSLGNLALFPGRFEFLEFLPSNTQSLYVQPLSPNGAIVVGSATQRGYTILDQVSNMYTYLCFVTSIMLGINVDCMDDTVE